MSSIADFLNAVAPTATSIFVFDRANPDEAGQDIPVARVEVVAVLMSDPWIDLRDADGMVEAVPLYEEEGAIPGVTLQSVDHDLIEVALLAEPESETEFPEHVEFLLPLPGGDWDFDEDTSAPLYTMQDGSLTPVNTEHEDEEQADAVAPEAGVPEEAPDGAGDTGDDAGDHGDREAGDAGEAEPVADAGVVPEGEGSGHSGNVAADGRAGGETPEPDAAPEEDAAHAGEEGEGVALELLNQATVLGFDDPDFDRVLNREAVFLTGNVWPDKPHKSTQAGQWKSVKLPMAQHVVGFAKTNNSPEYGLSRHPVGKTKDGMCMVLGSSIGGQRKAKAMDTMHAIGLDIDSGASLEFVRDRILELGLAAAIYTSWNHKKRGLTLKRDDVLKKLEIDTDPTEDQVKDYLRNHGKNRFEEAFIQKVSIKEQKVQEEDGVKIILDTQPIDKFRVVFFLDEPVKLIELAERHDDALAVWEDKITGLAQKLLGVHFDTSCTDPSRLFYTARHAKGNEDWRNYLIKGKPLKFSDIEPMRKSLYTRNRDLNPFVEADDQRGEKIAQVVLPSGGILNEWHTKYGKSRFQIADMLQAEVPDKIRVSGGEKQGLVHVECPFEHLHSKEGGTATFAVNALDNTSEYWTWQCHHDACQDRHKLEFLGEALKEGWFPEDVLFSDDYLLPAEEEEIEDDPTEYEQPAPTGDGEPPAAPEPKDPLELAKKITSESTDDDVKKFFKRLIKRGVDEMTREAVMADIAARTPLGKRQLTKWWRDIVKERAAKEKENEGGSLIPRINETSFQDLCEYGMERIRKANKDEKRVFHYMENLCIIRDDSHGNARLKMLDERGFAHLLNSVATFEKSNGDNATLGVSAPRDVVAHLFADDYSQYPALRGVVTSPTFSASGQLIIHPGYHAESALYYQPNNTLVVEPISPKPTEAELREAKRLIVEECFADFPLGGKLRPEIVAAGMGEALEGQEEVEDIPALANLIALTLLPFCREMVDGPTPGHLLNKPAPGTGASLLTDVLSMISTGQITPAMSMPTSSEEMGKTLTSVLANGQNIVFFDNINHSVDSGELASAMTTPTYGARILGKSQTVQTEVRCVWIFTGNNVTLSGELVRRLVMIDLDARTSSPEKRQGWRHGDIRGWVAKNRGRLVWACLTLIQHWIAEGKPMQKNKILASYENWSAVIGGILESAGIGGFMGNREMLKARTDDDDSDTMQYLIEEWWTAVGNKPIYVRSSETGEISVQSLVAAHEIPMNLKPERNAEDPYTFSAQALGRALGSVMGRVFELENGQNVAMVSPGKDRKGKLWRLELLSGGSPKGNVDVA